MLSEATPPLSPHPLPGSKRQNSKAINQTQVPIRTHQGRGTLKGPKSPACTDPSQNPQVCGGRRQTIHDGNKTLQRRKNHLPQTCATCRRETSNWRDTLCSHTGKVKMAGIPQINL